MAFNSFFFFIPMGKNNEKNTFGTTAIEKVGGHCCTILVLKCRTSQSHNALWDWMVAVELLCCDQVKRNAENKKKRHGEIHGKPLTDNVRLRGTVTPAKRSPGFCLLPILNMQRSNRCTCNALVPIYISQVFDREYESTLDPLVVDFYGF